MIFVPRLMVDGLGVGALLIAVVTGVSDDRWSPQERAMISSLSLTELGPVPPDPSNRVADDPRAVDLGRAIFFDTRFSADGTVSCATCHQPVHQFQDDLPLGHGIGTAARRTMPLAGVAHSPFLFWDGRSDSLWSQALGPMESPMEHGGNRTQYAHLVADAYRAPYEALFGTLPDLRDLPRHAGPVPDPEASTAWAAMAEDDRRAVSQVFANIGKAIAAYERTIQPPETRFDAYAAALSDGTGTGILTDDEVAGLGLFIGKGECVNCHNGPLFSDGHFHNTGVPPSRGTSADPGRTLGAKLVQKDPFNCLGPFSDAEPEACVELRFIAAGGPDEPGAFKTPSLRGAANRPPYMHAGQIVTLGGVLQHYQTAPEAAGIGRSELRPLDLSDTEIRLLEAFLATLVPLIPN